MNMTCLWKIISASVLLLAASVIANPALLASDECLDDVSWPDPTNCSRYYVCTPWGPQIMDCAPGTHYNPELQVCDWPEAVGCVVSTTVSPSTVPNTRPPRPPPTEVTEEPSTEESSTAESTESPEEPTTEESTGLPEEPTGTPEEATEDPTETEEPSTESPEQTGTTEAAEPTETPESEPSTPSEPESTVTDLPVEPTTITTPLDICAEFPNLFFITSHPTDCVKFIACNYGVPFILDCPTGQFFSPLISTCVTDSSHCT